MTDLGIGVNAVELGASVAIPEADAAVRSASPRCQEVGLKRAPGQGLDSRAVGSQAVQGSLGGGRACSPDVQQIVVASAGQLLAVGGPLEAAHLLLMTLKHSLHVLAHPAARWRLSEACQPSEWQHDHAEAAGT